MIEQMLSRLTFFYLLGRTKTLGLICPFPLLVVQMVPHDLKFGCFCKLY
jgi:hypothetical protein